MDTTPITGVDELEHHLDELVDDPDLPLQPKLFDHVELQLTESNIPPLIPRMLPKLTVILGRYTKDPTVLASLAIRLLGPVTFTQILSLASEESLVQALRSPAPAVNILAMTILHKAADTASAAAILSNMPQVVAAFLRRWLASPHVGVGEKGGKVLGDVLDVDCELPPPPPPPRPSGMTNGGDEAIHAQIVLRKAPGQGAMWRRVFRDQHMYSLVLDLCSGKDADTAGDVKQRSLAQGRLLRVLPRLAAINFAAVSAPAEFLGTTRNQSLLQFAALDMIDKYDVLMALSLVDFFEAFVSITRVTPYSSAKVETIRGLLRQATAGDDALMAALLSLPDRTVPEEADNLRRWLQEVLPGGTTRVAARRRQ